MRDIILSIIISVLGFNILAEHMRELNDSPITHCATALQRSHEAEHRFNSSAHTRQWCSDHVETWQTKVSHATILEYRKLTQRK